MQCKGRNKNEIKYLFTGGQKLAFSEGGKIKINSFWGGQKGCGNNTHKHKVTIPTTLITTVGYQQTNANIPTTLTIYRRKPPTSFNALSTKQIRSAIHTHTKIFTVTLHILICTQLYFTHYDVIPE